MRRLALALLCALGLAGAPRPARAEDPPAAALEERTLPLRTALHHDPTLAAPLERLIEMHREAQRLDELLETYRSHVRAWPADASARVVLIRLLDALGEPEAFAQARAAVAAHPEHGALWALYADQLERRNDPGALAALTQAIEFARSDTERRQRIERLLPRLVAEGHAALAEDLARRLAGLVRGHAEAAPPAAEALLRLGLAEPALALVEEALATGPSPELAVDLEALAADALAARGDPAAAAARLDAVLGRLTADHWRRPDLLRRRARLAADPAAREALLAAARTRAAREPGEAAASVDLARLLLGLDRRREAREVLEAGLARWPDDTGLEALCLQAVEEERDPRALERFLAARLERQPTRQDLRERRAQVLLALGQAQEGLEELARAHADLPEAARLARAVEAARALRARGSLRAAAALLERVLAAAPARADLRRELAECLLESGQRAAARRLLGQPLAPETDLDAFLDLLGLLRRERFLPEALAQVEARLAAEPRELALHLARLELRARAGRHAGQGEAAVQARTLADTPARYRRWLDAALEASDLSGALGPFLEAEAARLGAEQAAAADPEAERLVAFADASAPLDPDARALTLLRERLARPAPPALTIRLRRALAAALESKARDRRASGALAEAAAELERLAEEDAEGAPAHRARLALLRAREGRHDLAARALEGLDVRRLSEPGLVERVGELCGALGDRARALAALERLVEVDPGRRNAWEAWLAALCATGDEARLRRALRRLLAGVEPLPLAASSRAELRTLLGDSCWRSVALALDRGGPREWVEALALLSQAEALAPEGAPQGWALLARVLVLDRLGDGPARAEAHERLEAWLAQRAEDPAAALCFPDGVRLQAAELTRLLETRPRPDPEPSPAAEGPAHPTRLLWRFDHPGRDLVAVLPLGPDALLLVDAHGGLLGVEEATGRLRWAERTLLPPARKAGPLWVVEVPLTTPDGQVLVPHIGGLTCLGPDGRRRWVAAVGAPGPHVPRLFLRGDRVIAASAPGGEAAAFEAATGRALWSQRLPLPLAGDGRPEGSGAALEGERLFVYGRLGALLDARDGRLIWLFDPAGVRAFPPRLEGPRGRSGTPPNAPRLATPGALAVPPPPSGPASGFVWITPSHGGQPVLLQPAPGQPFGAALTPAQLAALGLLPPGSAGPTPGRPAASILALGGRSLATWDPRAPEVSAAAAGAAWAAPLGPEETRRAWIAGGRLYLSRHRLGAASRLGPEGHVLEVDLDLPFRVAPRELAATPLEDAPHLALAPAALLALGPDLTPERALDLTGLGAAGLPFVPCVARDGPHWLLAGPAGVWRVTARTLERVGEAPWPAGSAAPQADGLAALTCLPEGLVGQDAAGRLRPAAPARGLVRAGRAFLIVSRSTVLALADAEPEAADGGR